MSIWRCEEGSRVQEFKGLRERRMGEKTKSFEEMAVFKRARALVSEIYAATRGASFAKDRGLVDQLRRASVSIISNIGERFERGGNPELIQFLYVSKGSCGEIRAQLMVALDQGYISKESYDALNDEARRIGAMISNLIVYLKKSHLKGVRYL
jgi:four helix bundle protein